MTRDSIEATRSDGVPPAGRRERRKAATREQIISAGRSFFSEKGLYEASVEEITDRAGIAKGTLYQYYDGKEALILAVVSSGFDQLRARIDPLGGSLEEIAEAHARFFVQNPDLLRVFHQVRGLLQFNRPEWRPLRRVLAAYLRSLTAALGRTPEGTRVPARRRRELAGLLFGSISGTLSLASAMDAKGAVRMPTAAEIKALGEMASTLLTSHSPPRKVRTAAPRKETS